MMRTRPGRPRRAPSCAAGCAAACLALAGCTTTAPTAQPSTVASTAPAPSATRASASPRLVAQWPVPAGGEPVGLATTPGTLWVARTAPAGTTAGQLDRVDAGTGTRTGSFPIGGAPTAVAAGTGVWVSDGAEPGAEPDTVVEFDTSGNRRHTYHVANPVSLAVDGDQAWVGSVTGDRATVRIARDGALDQPVALPGDAVGGALPLVHCAGGLFAATGTADQTIVLQVAADGTVTHLATLAGRGQAGLACEGDGLLVALAADTTTVTRLAASGAVTAHTTVPSRTATVVSGDPGWLLLAGADDRSLAQRVDPATLAATASLTLPGNVVAAASTGTRLWLLQAGGGGPTIDAVDG
jgi:hypothetical protein